MKQKLITLMLFAMFLFVSSLEARDKLVFSTFPDVDPATVMSERILKVAYKELDISIEMKKLPGKRALAYSNKGRTDGELFRILGINKTFKNLIPVMVPVHYFSFVVFTKDLDFEVNGWQSLQPYKISYLAGIALVEQNTKGMMAEPAISMKQGFQKLLRNRSDVMIETRISGLSVIKENNFEGIIILEPPLQQVPVYHYLNKKHSELIPKLEEVMRRMEQDHTTQQIRDAVLDEFFN